MALVKDFEIDGWRAVIVKHDTLGHLCGYLALPAGHRLYGKYYEHDDVPDVVHGGWTYAEDHAPNEKPDGKWYLGFDCAHVGDLIPGVSFTQRDNNAVYRDEAFVEAELRNASAALQ